MWEELRENNNEKPHKHKYSRMKIVKLKSKEFSFNLFSFTKKIKPAVRHLFKFKFSSLKKLSPRNIKFTKKKIFISLFTFGVLSLISGVLINKILNPHHFKGAISLDKTTYTVEDDIHVNLKNISSDTDKVIIRLENDKGQEIQTENVKQLGKDKSLSLSILPTKHLKPGRYKIRASDFYGNSIVQDFVWGVLALNTNKSIYAPNETAKFEMAVLDATGKMVCDAKVTLKVTLPQSGKEEVLSTDNGKLKTTPQCDSYGFSLIPDFMAQLALVEVGQYKMHLMSHTKTGDFEISDSFEVKENVPFDVERITATRIYPYFAYPVTLRIKANQDFDGKIQEIVPEEFGVTYDTKINVPKLESKKGNKVLTWKEKFKKGEEIELTYKYKSPLVSPDFYLLGKASFIENNTKVFEETRKWQIAIDAIGGPTEVTPNADNGAQAWTCTAGSDGNCVTGHYTVLDDGSGTPSTSGYISTGTGGSTGEVDAWDMTTFTPTPNLNNITSVTAYIYDQSATNANGGTLDDVGISVYMGGAYQTDVAVTPVFNTWGWQSATFTGSWTSADLDAMRVRVTRTRQGSGSPASQDDDVQIATVYATVTYGYSPLPPKITQEGYTFENDDEDQTTGDANDSNTVQAGTTFTSGKTLTSVKKGERMTLRMHVKNTALASATQNFGLFYDRNDGIFTKVSSTATVSASGGGSCGTSPQTGSDSWDCTVIDDHATDQMGYYTSMAIDPSGNPWISYYNQTTMALTVAQYVGSGGNCNTSKAWSCTVVDDHASNAIGYYTSIAFDSSGTPWISYQNQTTLALVVAQYVGSGGNCNSYLSHTGSAAWNCTVVDDHATDSMGWYTSIAIDSSGNPWVSYQNVTTGALVIAQYVGSGGNCNSYLSHTGSAAWNCTVVDDHATDDLGLLSSLAFDSSGTPWISYYNNTTKALVVAKYVGTGGNCNSYLSHTGSAAWSCTVVDDHPTDSMGAYNSLAFDPSGNPWVSYRNSTTMALTVAQYVGSGGNCDSYLSHTGSDAWNCTVVDDHATDDISSFGSLAFDPSGNPWISYNNHTTLALVVAQYVGSGGNCDTYLSHTGSDAWNCTVVDDHASDDLGWYTSIAFDPSGNPWISYSDLTAFSLKVAKLKRSGEITIVPSLSGATGDALSASHADMTSATDATGQGDADCLTATTWNNGKLIEGEEGNLTIPDGSSASQCSEIAFVIDTSHASPSETYRFVIATDDAIAASKGKWRGPIAVSANGYPTLTIEADNTTPFVRYSKDNTPDFANCTSTSWGCLEFMDDGGNVSGEYARVAIDGSGKAWVSYFANSAGVLRVAEYVGSGGTGCTLSSAWNCVTVDDPAGTSVGSDTSIAIDKNGRPWIAYKDVTSVASLKVARYVGSGGTGCGTGSAAWTCTTVDDHASDDLGSYSSIGFDKGGNAWISYQNNTTFALVVAKYVGSGGNCDSYLSHTGSDAWNCTVVDDHATDDLGWYTSIAFDPSGNPWISYENDVYQALVVAQYVGSGGNCDSYLSHTGSDAWNCTVVDDHASNSLGFYTSLAFDPSGNPWISYYNASTLALVVAKYVGSGGNCNSYLSHTGSAAWSCTVVDDHATDNIGAYTSLAFDSSGNPWISYKDATAFSLKVATYVGSGGNCDTAPETGSDAWNCTVVQDTAGNFGNYSSIAFDLSGTPWVSAYTSASDTLTIAKLHVPFVKPISTNQYNMPGINAKRGTARYMLSSGKAPASESGSCSSITDNKGYCALTADDSDFDSITALPTERPLAVFGIRGSSNSTAPVGKWIGRTNLAPNTSGTAGDINLEVYRFGSTNAWEALASDSTSADCSSADCTVTATAAGTAAEYYEADGSNYWVYLRAYQIQDGTTTVTFKSDYISSVASATPPTVTTDAATSVSATSATLNSTVNPNSLSTDVFYKYDTADVACASLATTTSTSNIGSGSVDVSPNSVPISGLSNSTTYYFCAAATNSSGTTYGTKLNFSTSAGGGGTTRLHMTGGTKIIGGAKL